jgi:hypothetical protein
MHKFAEIFSSESATGAYFVISLVFVLLYVGWLRRVVKPSEFAMNLRTDMPSTRSLRELDEWERSRVERLARGLDAAEQVRRQAKLREAFSSAAIKFTGLTEARLPDDRSSRWGFTDIWRNARNRSTEFLLRLIGRRFGSRALQSESAADVGPE